jgi:magnesium-protoporphyrin O-methyltransferase
VDCCQCQGIEQEFSVKEAARMLKSYRNDGPGKTTRALIEALLQHEVEGLRLLDIGGGVGAIQHALAKAGASSVTVVEASSAYARTAQAEARRQGLQDRISVRHADFVAVAPDIEPHDLVTLDRVICCYHDMQSLLGLAAERANHFIGLVYPKDRWWTRALSKIGNLWFRLRRSPFRSFIHPEGVVLSILRQAGLRQVFFDQTAWWQIAIWARGE